MLSERYRPKSWDDFIGQPQVLPQQGAAERADRPAGGARDANLGACALAAASGHRAIRVVQANQQTRV